MEVGRRGMTGKRYWRGYRREMTAKMHSETKAGSLEWRTTWVGGRSCDHLGVESMVGSCVITRWVESTVGSCDP